MAAIAFKIPLSRHADLMARAPMLLKKHLVEALRKYGHYFVGRMIRERLSQSGVQPPGGGLARRTGALARGFDYGLTDPGRLNGLRLVVFTDIKYAAIHEFGGTVTPTRGQYLAIPLDAAKTAAGVSRGSPRDYSDTFVITSKRGNKLICQRKGKDLVPLFVLKKSVFIPPRLGMRNLWKQDSAMRQKRITEALTRAWREAR